MLTLQEIFNKVALHLMTQMRTARGPRQGCDTVQIICYYRSPNGDKCAAGCLISEENYSPSLEGKDAKNPTVADALFKDGVNMNDLDVARLVINLQICHDRVPPRVEDWSPDNHRYKRQGGCWKTELIKIANEFHLEIPECLK